MFIYFWVFYEHINSIFLFILCLFLCVFILYVKWLKIIKPILYKSYYFLAFSFFSLFFSYYYLEILLLDLFSRFIDEIYIRDPYDFVNAELDFFCFYSFFYIILYLILISLLYLINFISKKMQGFMVFLTLSLLLYSFIWKYLVETDLFSSNWQTLANGFKFTYKIQLDIAQLTRTFFEELVSLFNFLCILIIWYLFQIFKFVPYIWNKNKIKINKYNKVRQIITIIFYSFLYIFLGGETFDRDILLFIYVIFIAEISFLSFLFFYKLKTYKR